MLESAKKAVMVDLHPDPVTVRNVPVVTVYRGAKISIAHIYRTSGLRQPKNAKLEECKKPVLNGLLSWCQRTELNCRHYDFQSYALPTELLWREPLNIRARELYVLPARASSLLTHLPLTGWP